MEDVMIATRLFSRVKESLTDAWRVSNMYDEARDFDRRAYSAIIQCDSTETALKQYDRLEGELHSAKKTNLIPEHHKMPFAQERLDEKPWDQVKAALKKENGIKIMCNAIIRPPLR
tara:strand:- start:80 stop:427 length:348 start_codon:yes stop_codon:yes gene_type:complete